MKKRKRDNLDDLFRNINVISQEEAEKAELVICMPDTGPRYFTDDVRALCASCGIPIKHRPHVPKRPLKVCIHCGLRIAEEERSSRQPDA